MTNPPTTHYDYIIAGAGCAGLSLLHALLHQPKTANKKILIIDQSTQLQNDRTWCFWQAENQHQWYNELICKTWDNLHFFSDDAPQALDTKAYRYNMIEAIDFYDHFRKIIPQYPNVVRLQNSVETLVENDNICYLHTTDHQVLTADYIFSSIRQKDEITQLKKPTDIWYLQHFKGWVIEVKNDIFDENTAFFMDFNLAQRPREAHFGYVLPKNRRTALIEYTVFSDNLLEQNDYDQALKNYISSRLKITETDYTITHQEYGIIPMTNAIFNKRNASKKIINIGSAGGYSKPSTGYTFVRIQEFCGDIAQRLAHNKPLKTDYTNWLFFMYDSIFLDVFDQGRVAPKMVFAQLFKKNSGSLVLRFLDEKTNVFENIKIMSSVQILPFLQSALRQIYLRLRF